MKIGFVLDDSLDKVDGVQQYVITLGKWLNINGHDVHYLVGETKRVDLPNIHSLSKNIAVRFNRNRMSIPLPVSTNKLRKFLLHQKFDILHVQMPYSPWLAGRIIKAAPDGSAIVGTFHVLPFGKVEKIATKILALYTHRLSKKINQILSVSPAAKDFCLKSYGLESVVLPNAVDLQAFKVKRESDQLFKIVFLGRLVARKGCEQLLQALRLLPDVTLKKIVVIIGGKGPERKKLESLASGLPINFIGFVQEEDKPKLLTSADLSIFPSLGGESFGIILIESMASGSVVLAGDNPGYRSVLENLEESLINPYNTKLFSDKINTLVNDDIKRLKVRYVQQELLKQYDVESVGQKLIKIYSSAIANKL